MLNIRISISALLLLSAALGGCAPQKPLMYQWQGYEGNVNSYFHSDKLSLEAQTKLAEEDLVKIKAAGGVVPPGYNAHLGLLYGQQGQLDQFAQQVKTEKNQYPESEKFMDFLLRNFKK
jgi:hypothetical protein